MVETVSSGKGVFSQEGMPESWKLQGLVVEEKRLLLAELSKLVPGCRVISEIPRSSFSSTFVIRDRGQLKVCQFGPPVEENDNLVQLKQERQNPNKFSNSKRRFDHLNATGISVPRVFSVGFTEDLEPRRGFVVMEFIKGVSADRFIDTAPEHISTVFRTVGEQLGKLSNIELIAEDKNDLGLNFIILERQKKFLGFLIEKGIFTSEQTERILTEINNRMGMIPSFQPAYVHLDPFPVNWHITGPRNGFKLTLMDIEAIQVGHPWIEGIARALQWAGRDWFHLKGKPQQNNNLLIDMIEGFNQAAKISLPDNGDFIEFLMETGELFWLPKAMVYELLKIKPQESPERRKKAVLKIVEK